MGLMSWLLGGGRTETGTGAGAGGAGVAPAPPRERVDPSELPPIQRTLGAQDLVIDPAGFQGSLSTRQDVSLGTPLGHLVSPDAPTGLVHGISAPAGTDGPAAVDRPSAVQRSVERRGELPVGTRFVPLSVPLSVPVQRVVPGDAPAMTSAGAAAVAELPVRQLVGEQPLVAASGAVASEAEPPAPGPSSPPAPPVQRSVMPAGPAPGTARRAPGLGAPMSALPPTAQRQADVEGSGAEAGGMPMARSAVDGGGHGDSGGGEVSEVAQVPVAPEVEPDAGGPTAPLLGDSPLLPAASDSTPPGPTQAVQRTPAVPPQAPLAPPPSTSPVAPLLADRPVTLRNVSGGGPGAVQRSAVDGVAPSPPAGAGPGPMQVQVPGAEPVYLDDAVPVRWTSGGAGTPSMASATPSAPAALQRTAAAPGQATGAPPLPALQRQAVGGPPVPRSLPGSGGTGTPTTARVPSAPSFITAGSAAVAAGVAQRMADGSVVFGSPPPPYAPPVVQRETETEEPPPPDPPAQELAPEPDPEPEAGPVAEGHGPPGAAAATGPGGAPVVTDELVRALYPPLSRLFKADLRLERERAGFLINTRH
ncbi:MULTISPECIES: hypothetical protein [unclassified Streptomyces]|uniref:hypothetical protein n=1 Tax=unclassified Streptomyces TaxID=2593676 RepID=UPI00081BB9FD|nr:MULTISPECIES: hypothetical protein [unclassified Streptomyces]MYQ88611.1 hypothetical protein [Streptomyces sp. SID4936]SCE56096.1 hypothetical protein GA0115234_112226 [Streptomyces sp. DvalAA-43]